MANSTFILAYILTFIVCIAVTLLILLIINKGLKKYFENLSQDSEVSTFFIRITNLIILLGGLSAALKSVYDTGEKANWLTLTWDAAEQLKETLSNLFITLIILAITFFILHLIARRLNK